MAISAKWQDKVDFFVGDTVKINYRIIEEGKKERIQGYEGVVIGIKGRGESKTFTVRRIGINKVGIERIFPLNSPWIKELKVIKKPRRRIRRAKLYFLRGKLKKGKKKI